MDKIVLFLKSSLMYSRLRNYSSRADLVSCRVSVYDAEKADGADCFRASRVFLQSSRIPHQESVWDREVDSRGVFQEGGGQHHYSARVG